ncbi:MAG: hypothetical protein GOMPHAMPRED_003570 [Gomphillus americanus]|uniref:Uncharacterized protein n=1 Tax=Gomphillus americanus TaxID=1940652 RepID=A0A8H3FGW6_9LECA|nr:MAG: hypothetical protein GOMPHAMPRED_003570 [Gomphillus americanus]
MIQETIDALHTLNKHPETTFTIITGSGRFFSAGADLGVLTSISLPNFQSEAEKKLFWLRRFTIGVELIQTMIDHSKVLVLTMNGPGVGGGAAWFQGVADLFYMADDAWLQVTFSELGLVPEMGSAVGFAQQVGVRRANEWLMFGRRVGASELQTAGMVNAVFPKEDFERLVCEHLGSMLKERDGKSLMEVKRLQSCRMRDARMLALYESWHALAERFVEGGPLRRLEAKLSELEVKRKTRLSKI